MVQVRPKPEVGPYAVFEVLEVLVPELLNGATTRTDQVMMCFGRRPLEHGISGAHVRHRRQPHPAQHIERAIHGAHINEWEIPSHLFSNLRCRHMALRVPQGADNQQPLWRKFVARAPQQLCCLVFATHCYQSTESGAAGRVVQHPRRTLPS